MSQHTSLSSCSLMPPGTGPTPPVFLQPLLAQPTTHQWTSFPRVRGTPWETPPTHQWTSAHNPILPLITRDRYRCCAAAVQLEPDRSATPMSSGIHWPYLGYLVTRALGLTLHRRRAHRDCCPLLTSCTLHSNCHVDQYPYCMYLSRTPQSNLLTLKVSGEAQKCCCCTRRLLMSGTSQT